MMKQLINTPRNRFISEFYFCHIRTDPGYLFPLVSSVYAKQSLVNILIRYESGINLLI